MAQNSVISLFKSRCKSVLDAGPNLLVYPNISDSDRAKVRSHFQLDLNETILFVADDSFWATRNQGLVLTDLGITCIPNKNKPDEIVSFTWQQTDHAQYKELNIYFFDSEGNNIPIGINYFFFNNDENYLARKGRSLAEAFTEIAKSVEPEEDPIDEMDAEINRMLDRKEFRQAAGTIKSYINQDDGTYKSFWYWRLARVLRNECTEDKDKEAKLACLEGIKYCEDGSPISVLLHYELYSILVPYVIEVLDGDISNYALAKEVRKESFHVSQIATNEECTNGVLVADDSKADFEAFDEAYCKLFLSLPYNERKVLIPVKDYTDLSQDHIAVLKIDKLPSEVVFPIGHPVANQVYVGHPYLPQKYIPFENYQLELIEDKIREFCQIAQCLGATEISIDTENSSQSNSTSNYTQDINGGIEYKGVGVSGGRKRSGSRSLIEEISQAINLHQTFVPSKAPYLPEKIVWYQNEPSWQRLYEQRMSGGLSQHEERIETRKNQVVDNHELQEVKAELQCLFASANLNWNTSIDDSFSQQENAILSIKVKFAPLASLSTDIQQPILASSHNNDILIGITDLEQEYLDMVSECMEDGEIGSRERKLLEKIRVKNGISEERAKELEATLNTPQLTDDEKEYLEAFKDACEDGKVSDKQRRLLEKLRVMYGISEERARELEK